MQKVFAAPRLFSGSEWLLEHELVLRENKILQVSPRTPEAEYYARCMIVPAFIDLQVYGAGGRLLAEQPDADTLQTMQEIFSSQGTQIFLPTVATNTIEVFNAFLLRHHFVLNDSGGVIKTSPDKGLLQSSTVAKNIEAVFAGGEKASIVL